VPAILTALVIVLILAGGFGVYAVVTSPTRQQAKLELQRARDGSRLDANHHQMYLFLTELEIKDSYTETLFNAVDRDRAKQLLSTYRKELTS
jgi:hypothetical protein